MENEVPCVRHRAATLLEQGSQRGGFGRGVGVQDCAGLVEVALDLREETLGCEYTLPLDEKHLQRDCSRTH